jgi:hypothetical protein
MRAIIMADGKALRWYAMVQQKFWGDKSKQLVEVNGEPILHRTVRLCCENGVDDVWITSHQSEHDVEGATRYEPEINFDKFYAAKRIWNVKETLFLYGDVFYTEEAMKTIVNTPIERFLFFGQFGVSPLTGHGGEIYAVRIKGSAIANFIEAILMCYLGKELQKGKNSAWEILRYMNGVRGNELYIHAPQSNFIEINDLTDDFDTPEHYEHWLEIYDAYR